jgi:exonuclease VII large subunit
MEAGPDPSGSTNLKGDKEMKKQVIIAGMLVSLFFGGGVGYAVNDWFEKAVGQAEKTVESSGNMTKEQKQALETAFNSYKSEVENQVNDKKQKLVADIDHALDEHTKKKIAEMEKYFIGEKLMEAHSRLQEAGSRGFEKGKSEIDAEYDRLMKTTK